MTIDQRHEIERQLRRVVVVTNAEEGVDLPDRWIGEAGRLQDHATVLWWSLVRVLVDLGFLAGVVGILQLANIYFFDRFDPTGTAKVVFNILDWATALSLLGTVLSYLLRDMYIAVRLHWKRQ